MKRLAVCVALLLVVAAPASAQQWVASWTGAAHGPYPIANPTAQPELKFAFPAPAQGARDQTFRLVVKPDIWGAQTRGRRAGAGGRGPGAGDDAGGGRRRSG